MQLSASTLLKSKKPSVAGLPKVGDRVSFAADVLRILPSDPLRLLVMVQSSGVKLVIGADHVAGGAKLKGGDQTALTGTVTRVGSSLVHELSPVSIAVDGYSAMRVTVAAKSVKRAK